MRFYALVALGMVACSACSARTSDDARSEVEPERAGARSIEQANDPGAELFAVPSSFPEVATWTAYLGSGITVIGTDKGGERQAIVTYLMDSKLVDAIGCSTGRTSVDDCASLLAALAKDLQRVNLDSSPSSLHVLDLNADVRQCSIAMGSTLGTFRAESDLAPFHPNLELWCNPTTTPKLMAEPGQCWATGTNFHGDRVGMAAPGTPAQACCNVPRQELPGSLVVSGMKLICSN